MKLYVVKKDGTREIFNVEKIINAVNKSAARILYKFSEDEIRFICNFAGACRVPGKRKYRYTGYA